MLPTIGRSVCERTGRRVVRCDSSLSDRDIRLAGTRKRTTRSDSATSTITGRTRRRRGHDRDCRTLFGTCATVRRRSLSATTLRLRGMCISALSSSTGKVCDAVDKGANMDKVRDKTSNKASDTSDDASEATRTKTSTTTSTKRSTRDSSKSSKRSDDCDSKKCRSSSCSKNCARWGESWLVREEGLKWKRYTLIRSSFFAL